MTASRASSPQVALSRLLLVFLWLGLISLGGKSAPYIFDEFVRRRGWLRQEEYAEAYALAKLLPGPSGPNTAIFVLQTLHGTLAALLCLAPYTLPGAAVILALAVFLSVWHRPAWVDGGVHGLAIGAIALLATSGLRMVPSARSAQFGLTVATLAFVATAILRWDLLIVLAGLGAASLWLNRPRSGGAEDA